MIIPIPPKSHRKRPPKVRKPSATVPTPPAALVLVSAAYQTFDDPILTLVFDRAINIDAFEGPGIFINDGATIALG